MCTTFLQLKPNGLLKTRGDSVLHAWTEADQALWAGVLNFWFLGRVFDKVRP